MLIDHRLFTFKFQYEMYVLICLFESGLFKVDTRFCSSQHVHVLYIFVLDIVLSRRCSKSRVGPNKFGLERS